MNRQVDLLSYLPPFLQEFKENRETLNAENPEFILAWNGADRVLKNEFIETADEYGISRFERILKITPLKTDTLEIRRRRVMLRWFDRIPYTLRAFLEELSEICRDSDFSVVKEYLKYKIGITTDLEEAGQVEELDRLIEEMMPCNMVVTSANKIPCGAEESLYMAGTVCYVEHIEIIDDGVPAEIANCETVCNAHATGAVSHMEHIEITEETR
ncbi:MAG: YmfQ family protein [Lachnospiraceae bacterium]|nr:YmfQ family protein [Lachnospiraceae bacterium]